MSSRADYERFFRQADADGSGSLSTAELVGMLKKQGYRGSDSQIRSMFISVDTSGDGLISLDEYLEAMGAVPPKVHKSAAARQVFRAFDKDDSGSINKDELKQVFKEMGKSFSDAELQRMVELCDSDGDGQINYDEFVEKIFGGSG